ncbi:hypothetical protein MMC16_000720 [Acarospora aff. strigata]|nr:hypothetical protein [Acarospora aff. strigata]
MPTIKSPTLSAATMTKAELDDVLLRYDTLIERLDIQRRSNGKGKGKGQSDELDLKKLDTIRYVDIPRRIEAAKKKAAEAGKGKGKGKGEEVCLEKAEVETLVRWKLYVPLSLFLSFRFWTSASAYAADALPSFPFSRTHGKHRPRLTQLVASNPASTIRDTTRAAFALYSSSSIPADPSALSATITALTKPLKGIGPASASLLLSVYDPSNVPFFSDELYRWICWDEGKGGWGRGIRYEVAEYRSLVEGVGVVLGRLRGEGGGGDGGVGAVELEKVAFVLGREALVGGRGGEGVGVEKERAKGRTGVVAEEGGGRKRKGSTSRTAGDVDEEERTADDGVTHLRTSQTQGLAASGRKKHDTVNDDSHIEPRRSKRQKVH